MRSVAADESGQTPYDDADARFGMNFEFLSRPSCGANQFFGRVAQSHPILLRLSNC